MVTIPRPRDIRCSAQRSATAWTLVGGLLGYPIVVGASRRHREQGLGLLEEAGGNPGHGRLMRFHAIPYLDDRQTSRIIALDQQFARTTTRGVNDAGNDRAEKVAERRGFVRRGLELVYPGDRHERVECDGATSDPRAAGPLGALPVPAPAPVRRSQGAPASRSAPAAACSPRLRVLRAIRALRTQRGARSRRGAAAGAGPISRTPARAPRESWHAPARLARPRSRLRPG